MNSYQLTDKTMDKDFLAGNLIKGTAVFHEEEFNKDPIKDRDGIVIVLSSGKKYMGKVVEFNYEIKGGVIEGVLEIVKR